MSQKNRSRPIGIKLRFTQQELQLVAEKMEQLGTTNREAYLRKMAIDGYVLKLDAPELKEMVTLLRRMSSNVNQIARRMNETGRIYEVDMAEVQAQQKRIWEEMRELLPKAIMPILYVPILIKNTSKKTFVKDYFLFSQGK